MIFLIFISTYTTYQGSLLGLILTHEGAIKAILCIDFEYFKIHNEGGNTELCVTAIINKS